MIKIIYYINKLIICISLLFITFECKAELNAEIIRKFENGRYSEILQDVISLSNQKNDAAQVMLSKIYIQGLGVEKNYQLGKYWAEQSTTSNNSDGYNILGIIFQNGYGTEANLNVAIENYKKSIELKNIKAIINLGNLYFYNKQYSLALQIYLKYPKEDAFIRGNIGWIYENGLSAPVDLKLAKINYEIAAKLNNSFSQFRLANFYLIGHGVEKNYDKSMQLYEQASNGNYYEAQHTLGRLYLEGEIVEKNYEKGIMWLKKSIEGGYAESNYWLGSLYLNEKYIDRNIELGLRYLEDGARLNDRLSMAELARLNYYGIFMEKNKLVALDLYEKAALKNDINSIRQIALSKFTGNGTEKNYEESFKWYTKLALYDDERGLLKIAQMKTDGVGTIKDIEEANKIFKKLYLKNNRTAILHCYVNKLNCGQNSLINLNQIIEEEADDLSSEIFLEKLKIRIINKKTHNKREVNNSKILKLIEKHRIKIVELEKYFELSENKYSRFLKDNRQLTNKLLNEGFNELHKNKNKIDFNHLEILLNSMYIIEAYNFTLPDFSIASKNIKFLTDSAEKLLKNNELSDENYAIVVDYLIKKSFSEGLFLDIKNKIKLINTYAYFSGKLILEKTKIENNTDLCKSLSKVFSNNLFHKDIYFRYSNDKQGMSLNTLINYEELLSACKAPDEEFKLLLLNSFNSSELKIKDPDYATYINNIRFKQMEIINDDSVGVFMEEIQNYIANGSNNLAYEKLNNLIKIINNNKGNFKIFSESRIKGSYKNLILEFENYNNYLNLIKTDFKYNLSKRGENKNKPLYFDCDSKCFSNSWLLHSTTLSDYSMNLKNISDEQRIFLLKFTIYSERKFNGDVKSKYKDNELMQSIVSKIYYEHDLKRLISLLIKNKRFLEVEHFEKFAQVKELKSFTRAMEFNDDLLSENEIFNSAELKLFKEIKNKHNNLSKLRDYIYKLNINVTENLNDRYYRFVDDLFEMYSNGMGLNITSNNLAILTNKNKVIMLMNDDSVFLSYILSKDHIDILISRGEDTISKRVEVRNDLLTNKVFRFRNYLRKVNSDSNTVGIELYNLLIKPIEEHLPTSAKGNIFLSLNGVLRYIPFSAINDGQKYLIEKYKFTHYSELSKSPVEILTKRSNWKIAGFGVSKSVNNFTALPAVESELKAIIKNDVGGFFPGKIFINEDFTLKSFNYSLKDKYSVYHLATHFKFTPGIDENSFFQLGNGEKLTVADLSKIKFTGVDLLTLSACDTALGGSISEDGKEIAGITYLLQRQGAKSVISSLWAVNDNSTSIIMKDIYYNVYYNNLSKVNSLRSAQLAMLKSKDFSHPYYWAPFLLNGNIQ